MDFTLARAESEQRAASFFEAIQRYDHAATGSSGTTACACAVVSARLEAELAAKSAHAQCDYLESIGLEPTRDVQLTELMSYSMLPSKARSLLDLSIAYTGPGVPPERSQTTRAHLFRQKDLLTAGMLAGRIHGDILRGFVRAEVIQAGELLAFDNYAAAKDAGCIRTEGKDYRVGNADVVLVKWSG